MTIKAVLFDLGGTLVYSNPEETFRKILGIQGITEPIDRVKHALDRGNQEFDIDKHIGLSAHEFYTEWNIVQLKHLGVTDEQKARKLAETVDSQWFEFAQIHVFPEVKKTLRLLKKTGLKLGIVTGGYEEDIAHILPKTDLKRFFSVCVGANTTGKRKPHPESFKCALKRLGVKACEAVFVGDSLQADYMGAENAGMIPILLKREGSPVSGIRTIKRLNEIFEVLKQISS